MGVLECVIMDPDKTLQIWGLQPIWLSQWEPPRNYVLGAGRKVKISLTLTQFHDSFREVENLGQNVTENSGTNDSQMALGIFVIVEIHSLKGAERGEHSQMALALAVASLWFHQLTPSKGRGIPILQKVIAFWTTIGSVRAQFNQQSQQTIWIQSWHVTWAWLNLWQSTQTTQFSMMYRKQNHINISVPLGVARRPYISWRILQHVSLNRNDDSFLATTLT